MSLGRNVALLAIASFLADVSGEMLMAVLPFLLVAQGASGVGVGLVGGFADAVGHALKPVAGRLADRMGRRKPLIITGYLTAAIARVGIAASSAWQASLFFRSADRVGKGIRTAPRDALLAESVPREARGRAFGLHRAADTAGAVVGVALALGALSLLGSTPQAIVLAGAFIGLATAIPLLFVTEVDGKTHAAAGDHEPASPKYRAFVAIAGLFALGNVSYMFFVLRASDAIGGETRAVALYLLFNVVYVAAAYPLGRASDRLGRARVLLAGWLLFAASAALLVATPTIATAIAAFVVMGLSFAAFEGVQRAMAADLAGAKGRSTRLGVFHGVVGLAAVAGGLAAGLLWDHVAPWATFAFGALVSVAACGLLVAFGFARHEPAA